MVSRMCNAMAPTEWHTVDCKWLHKPVLRPLRSVEDANAQCFFLRMLYTVYGEISCTRSSAVQAQNATGEIALSTTVSRWLPFQLFVGPAIVKNLVEPTHVFWTALGGYACEFLRKVFATLVPLSLFYQEATISSFAGCESTYVFNGLGFKVLNPNSGY